MGLARLLQKEHVKLKCRKAFREARRSLGSNVIFCQSLQTSRASSPPPTGVCSAARCSRRLVWQFDH